MNIWNSFPNEVIDLESVESLCIWEKDYLQLNDVSVFNLK